MTDSRPAPTRLGRYEVVMKIAAGGMATVYLGRMMSKGAFQRSVAIKVLHPDLACDPGFVAMFLDEARLSAQIRHPNVVDVYDVDAEAGHLFIVMGYIEGASLYDLNKISRKSNRIIPRGIATRVVFDALTGLHAAHELADSSGRNLDIVHRDISPQNLLVGLDGTTRVTDFGVAKSAGRLATTGSRDTVKGKLQYLAPEQMQRDGELDRRVDVFAAGIILWELLTSRGLFVGGTHAETLAAVLTQPIPRPSKFAAGLGEALDDVCVKALERDRDKRFATAGDFADALEEAAQSVMATPKAVGKFVRDLAPPKVGEGREAMKSTLDPNEVAPPPISTSLTPPRRLTPGLIKAVAPPPPSTPSPPSKPPLALKRPPSSLPPAPKPPPTASAPVSRKPPLPPPRRAPVPAPVVAKEPPTATEAPALLAIPPPPAEILALSVTPPPAEAAPDAGVPVEKEEIRNAELPAPEPAPELAIAAFQGEPSDGPVEIEDELPPAPASDRQARSRKMALSAVAVAGVLGIGALTIHAIGSKSSPPAAASSSERRETSSASPPPAVTSPSHASLPEAPLGDAPVPTVANADTAAPAQSATPVETALPRSSAAPVAAIPPAHAQVPNYAPHVPMGATKPPGSHPKPPPKYVP